MSAAEDQDLQTSTTTTDLLQVDGETYLLAEGGTIMFDLNDIICFDEISSIANMEGTTFPEYDSNKLAEVEGVVSVLPAAPRAEAVVVESVAPDLDFTPLLNGEGDVTDMFLMKNVVESVAPDTDFIPLLNGEGDVTDMFLMKNADVDTSVETLLPGESYGDSECQQPTTWHYTEAPTPSPQPVKVESVAQSVKVESVAPQPVKVESVASQPVKVERVAQPVKVESVAQPLSPEILSPDALDISNSDIKVPKKRGRKRKYPEELSRRNREKRPKVYEMGPLEDEELEKKRLNAINAKKHRDMQKNLRLTLEQQLNEVKAERDFLKQRVQQLMQSEARLKQNEARLQHLLANKEQLQFKLANKEQLQFKLL